MLKASREGNRTKWYGLHKTCMSGGYLNMFALYFNVPIFEEATTTELVLEHRDEVSRVSSYIADHSHGLPLHQYTNAFSTCAVYKADNSVCVGGCGWVGGCGCVGVVSFGRFSTAAGTPPFFVA